MPVSRQVLREAWFTPVFSTLIGHRAEGLVIVGAGVLQVGLHLAGLPTWVCPFKNLLGIPCPGCGLTTAVGQLIHGQLGASLQTHAFAPFFVFSFFVLTLGVLLPQKQRKAMVAWLAGFERRTGATALFLTALMLYWVIRLAGLV